MLNYETLLNFVYFQIILDEQNLVFEEKVILIIVLEIPYSATYLDKSKG